MLKIMYQLILLKIPQGWNSSVQQQNKIVFDLFKLAFSMGLKNLHGNLELSSKDEHMNLYSQRYRIRLIIPL